MRRTILLLLPLCLVLSIHSIAQDWVEVRSPNLRMITDGDTKPRRDALWHLEQVRTEFGLVLSRKKINRNRPLFAAWLPNPIRISILCGRQADASWRLCRFRTRQQLPGHGSLCKRLERDLSRLWAAAAEC